MTGDSITGFLSGKTVFVTGATGFVGKALVEKILFAAPGVERIYVLIRPKGAGDERTPAVRLEREVTESPIFGRLRRRHGPAFEGFLREKVIGVAGDLGTPRFGLGDQDYARLTAEVSIVINSAAAVSFDERLDTALALNTLGARWTARFAENARASSFVHISTCYVSGTRAGDIPETAPSSAAGDLDADRWIDEIGRTCRGIEEASREAAMTERFRREAQRDIAAGSTSAGIPVEDRAEERRRLWVKERMVAEGVSLARRAGWNDTYTFTKALGEILVAREAKTVPTSIVRPSIIESSYREPEPGWIEGFRMADPILVAYGKGTLHDFPGRRNVLLDLIPLDHVVNATLAAAAANPARPELRVYQVATGDVNPLQLDSIYGYVRDYFARHPMHDASGREITPRNWRFPSAGGFRRYYRWRYEIPLRAVEKVLARFPRSRRAERYRERAAAVRSRVEQILYYAKIYAPYTAHPARYLTANTRGLLTSLSAEDRTAYAFDAASIDWQRYVAEIHIPGIKRWVLRMVPPEPLPTARPLQGLPDTAAESVENLRSIPDLLRRSVYRHHGKVALQIRRAGRPVQYTYGDVLELSRVVAHELRRSGIQRGNRVVLWAENQPEWGIGYLGIVDMGATAVPLDYQTPVKDVWKVAEFAESAAILTTEERARSLGRARPESHGAVGIRLLNLHAWGAPFGASAEIPDAEELRRAENIHPESLASILFTSGTTVAPKGVCLTHRNFLANVLAVSQVLNPLESDQFLSILPLHHALEFTGGFLTALFGGATITYLESLNAASILGTMHETGSSVVIAVPRLLEVFWNRIQEQVPRFLHFAWKDARNPLERILVPAARFVVGSRVRRRFGGRLRLFVVGGAALDPAIWEGFERLGFPVCEGYGLTETAPVVTVNPLENRRAGTVGPPLPEVEVQIDSPDERGIGEILVKGKNVMQGYLKSPERNRRVFRDNWFRTGDFGYLDSAGALHIVGRVDDLIVTPAGKNVHPDEVEALYKDLPGVKEFCVLGVAVREGAPRAIHAVVVPSQRSDEADRAAAEEAIQVALAERSREVPSHHRIQRVHFRSEELPKGATFKVKRGALQRELEAGLRAEARPAGEARLPMDEVSRQVLEALARICKTTPAMIQPTDRLQTDLGVDSLMRVDLAADLEHRFGRRIPDDRVEAWEAVADIVADFRAGLGPSA